VTTAADGLREKALQLPASDRALLASDLLASLDSDIADEAAVDESWSRETDRREHLLHAGDAELVTWDHLTERIAGRRPPPLSQG
jgi:putative addiction module component (TIGR02574 family)